MRLVNLTPHPITIVGQGGRLTVEPSGTVARARSQRVPMGEVEVNGVSVPVQRAVYGAVEGLPEPEADTLYMVSLIVASVARERRDLVVADARIRDGNGRVVGCRALGVTACEHVAWTVSDRARAAESRYFREPPRPITPKPRPVPVRHALAGPTR